MSGHWHSIDHVQLAMPKGEEAAARAFFVDKLGMVEVEKPDSLKAGGGLWLKAGAADLHLGVEAPFQPAKKAHPAFLVADIDGLAERFSAAGSSVKWDDKLAGVRRFFSHDCFGNRIEIVQQADG